MKNILLLFVTVLILFSCSVQKRKYQKGFYVSGKHSKTQLKNKSALAHSKKNENEVSYSKPIETTIENEPVITALAENNIKPAKNQLPVLFHSTKDELCDKITLKNGDEISAKVLEISAVEVKYKKCNVADGPLYIVKKADVFMITYANGTKDVFKTEEKANPQSNTKTNSDNNGGQKTTHELAILSLVFGITGLVFFLGSIAAIIAGNAVLRKIKANPEKYDGEDLAKVGKVIGIIGLALKILIVVLFIALAFAL